MCKVPVRQPIIHADAECIMLYDELRGRRRVPLYFLSEITASVAYVARNVRRDTRRLSRYMLRSKRRHDNANMSDGISFGHDDDACKKKPTINATQCSTKIHNN